MVIDYSYYLDSEVDNLKKPLKMTQILNII